MSTAIAAPPPPAALSPPVAQHSPRQYPNIHSQHSTIDREPKRARSDGSPRANQQGPQSTERPASNGRSSPSSAPRAVPPPLIRVKKEPGSPSPQSARPRPKRLDLSSSMANSRPGPQTARPSGGLPSQSSAGLGIQEVGLACLSPGFQTNDPGMREQLQRSLDVRDQQRMIIEARNKGVKPGHDHADGQRTHDNTLFGVQMRTPSTSKRKGPPPGLSINAPSAAQFAEDRVIQSAPMHQTFTGLRPGDPQFTRHSQLGPSGLSQTSHIHHVPATQTNNRLPPISDVFANVHESRGHPATHSPGHPSGPPPVPSPGFTHPQQPPSSARAREFRSAEEAVHGLSGGREDLMPKVVHYGGVQPPTPPSPLPPQHQYHSTTAPGSGSAKNQPHHHHHPHATTPQHHQHSHPPAPLSARPDVLNRTASTSGRRRGRDEYERDNGSPPSSTGRPESNKRATFAVRGDDSSSQQDWRTNMSGEEKRAEFLRLCERAWDLFHS